MEDCVVGVLAVGRTPLVRKLLESETARTCWRQPGQPADAVNQELRKKRESSRIPSRKSADKTPARQFPTHRPSGNIPGQQLLQSEDVSPRSDSRPDVCKA
nr:transmembrane protein 229B isoform X4 [Columba livia]